MQSKPNNELRLRFSKKPSPCKENESVDMVGEDFQGSVLNDRYGVM